MLTETDDLVGTMLGKDYRVLKPIGAGGMAVVYLVEHQTLLKQFAVKVLSPALASSLEARARFAQEAHAASQLDHENIVTITDFGSTADHRPYFVMELLRGETLDRRLAAGRMSLEEVVAVSVPVARALAHAHAEGVIHLDVKPENIFLVQRSQGRWSVKVVDFGIARTPQNNRITNPGEAVGTPTFMAPEVCCGADDVDHRADIYSFGILLYRMLCGRLPFVDDNMTRVLQMQLSELPVPPRALNAELSPELAAVVERALAKNPNDRYLSMQALLRDFDLALPEGADRLLIEAQSGTSLDETAFPRTITPFARATSRQDSQPPPLRPSGSLDAQPGMHMAHPSAASGMVSTHPPAAKPPLRLGVIIPSAVVALAVAGAVGWRQLSPADHRDDGRAATPAMALTAKEAATAGVRTTAPSGAASAAPAAAPGPDLANVAAPAAPTNAEPGVPGGTEVAADDDVEIETEVASASTDPSAQVAGKLAPRPARSVKRITAARGKRFGAAGGQGDVAASFEPAVPPAQAEAPASIEARPTAAPEPVLAAAPTAPPPVPTVIPAPAVPTMAAQLPPAPIPAAPRPSPGSLDAVPSVTNLDVKGSLSPAIVRRSVERALGSLRSCYRTAAQAGGTTPAIELQLRFEIDENGLATQVATGGAAFGTLGSCATGVASKIRTPTAPDVGTAQVTVGIRFQPA